MKRQNHKRRKAGILTIILTCALMLLPLSAFAEEDKEYSVPSADFTVEIGEDGTVQVTENWDVSYEKGKFNRFYKVLYRENLPKEETFGLVEDSVHVAIDGREAAWTDDTEGRPDDTYNVSKEGNSYSIYCYKTSENVTRHFEISYTLRDAVKIVDDEYYLFTFRLIGKGFEKEVEEVTATIISPDGSKLETRNQDVFNRVVDKGRMTKIEAYRAVDEVFKVKMRIDDADIQNAVPITDDDLSNNVDDDESTGEDEEESWWDGVLGDIVVWIIVIIGLWLLKFVFGLIIWGGFTIYERHIARKVSRRLEEDPTCYSGLLTEWQDRMSPTEVVCGRSTLEPKNLVYSYLSYFMSSGVVRVIDDDNMEVVKRDGLTEEELKVLDFLDVAGNPVGIRDDLIQVEKLCENIQTGKADLISFEKEIKKAVDHSRAMKLSNAAEAKRLEDALSDLHDYHIFLKTKKRNAEELSGFDLLCLLAYSAKESDDPINEAGRTDERANNMMMFVVRHKMYQAMDHIYTSADSKDSGSSGGGCSSCSSCSGCGCGGD